MSQHPETSTAEGTRRPHPVNVVIDGKHYKFADDHVTGRQIKEKGGIPDSYSLYRREHGGNEPIADDEPVKLHDGDHFFSRPPSNVS